MAKFKYGDRVIVCNEATPDHGKTGTVVEKIPDDIPWVTLDVDADEPYGGSTPPIGVAVEEYSLTRTTALGESMLELAPSTVKTTAGEVPLGGMFTTDEGGKFIRIDTQHVDGDLIEDGIVSLIVEPLDHPHALSSWQTTSWDSDAKVEIFV